MGKVGRPKDNGIVLHLETKNFFRYKLRTHKAKHYCYQILMKLTTMTTFTVTGMIKLSSYINELKKKSRNLCKVSLSVGLKKGLQKTRGVLVVEQGEGTDSWLLCPN